MEEVHYFQFWMYWLLDLSAKGPDPAGLKISLRFGAGTELSPLMGDRYWLERGLYWLLSQRLHCLHQVIWSCGTPADLPWIIVNLKSNSRAKFLWAGKRTDGGMKRWTRQIKPSPSEKTQWTFPPFHVAAVSSGWRFCVFLLRVSLPPPPRLPP